MLGLFWKNGKMIRMADGSPTISEQSIILYGHSSVFLSARGVSMKEMQDWFGTRIPVSRQKSMYIGSLTEIEKSIKADYRLKYKKTTHVTRTRGFLVLTLTNRVRVCRATFTQFGYLFRSSCLFVHVFHSTKYIIAKNSNAVNTFLKKIYD